MKNIIASLMFVVLVGSYSPFKLREEVKNGKRYIYADEINRKTELYLRSYKGIKDEAEIRRLRDRVLDRLVTLHRVVDFDAVHETFSRAATLDKTLADDAEWMAYVKSLKDRPKLSDYLPYIYGVLGLLLVVALALVAPSAWRGIKSCLQDDETKKEDAEWVGSDGTRKKSKNRSGSEPASFELTSETGDGVPEQENVSAPKEDEHACKRPTRVINFRKWSVRKLKFKKA